MFCLLCLNADLSFDKKHNLREKMMKRIRRERWGLPFRIILYLIIFVLIIVLVLNLIGRRETSDDTFIHITGGSNTPTFKQAQQCLKNSPFAPKNLPPLLTDESFVPNVDLKSHYLEMLEITASLRGVEMSIYADYAGPWIENHWIASFCCDKAIESFGGLVPLFIQWTDVERIRGSKWLHDEDGKRFTSALRRDVIYVTVSQHDNGITPPRRWGFQPDFTWNILVMSAGGFGHIPLPLIAKELDPLPITPNPPNLFVFAGRFHHFTDVRKRMRQAIEDESQNFRFSHWLYSSGPKWKEVMASGKLSLAPRGYGRTSFRLVESMHMGLVPVYVYDDDEWLPYKYSDADLRLLGFSIQIDSFRSWVRRIGNKLEEDPDYLKLDERRAALARVRGSHYSYAGVMRQIKYFFSDSPLSDLHCQRHPDAT